MPMPTGTILAATAIDATAAVSARALRTVLLLAAPGASSEKRKKQSRQ